MLRKTLSRVALVAAVAACLSARPAEAQTFGNPCAPCQPLQPVMQTTYQTVPVTEFQPVKQTVRRPVYRTEFVEEPVTVYRPVTEVHTREVPTVQYQQVTENRVIHRDMGRWVTQYRPNPRISPCQYDPRPGVIGWFNRTGHELRSAFRPRYTAIRQYQPRVVAMTVPQTRTMAVPTTQRVTYNVTRMVPTQTVQTRPVQRLTYVEEEVTVMRPQTTYRTVPIGTAVAYAPVGGSAVAYGGYAGGALASAQIVDDRPVRSALSPEPDSAFQRSASSENDPVRSRATDNEIRGKERFERPRDAARDTGDDAGGSRSDRESRADTPARRSGFTTPAQPAAPAESSARPYEGPNRGADAAPEKDPFDTFDTFQPDAAPSASLDSSSRYIRTGLTTRSDLPRPYTGWRARKNMAQPLASTTTQDSHRVAVARR